MKHTLRTTAAVIASVVALSLAGCHSGADGETVTIDGEHGKVYAGSANQVSTQMGQDYAAGLRKMATQTSTTSQ